MTAAGFFARRPALWRPALLAALRSVLSGFSQRADSRPVSPSAAIRLVSRAVRRVAGRDYLDWGDRVLEITQATPGFAGRVPDIVIAQLQALGEVEQLILGPGVLALPNLRVEPVGKVDVDVAALFHQIDAKPRAVLIVPRLVVGGGEKYAADLCRVLQDAGVAPILVIVTEQTERESAGWGELSILRPFLGARRLFWRDYASVRYDAKDLSAFLAYLEPEVLIATSSYLGLRAVGDFGRRLSIRTRLYCTYFNLGDRALGAPYAVTFSKGTTPFALSITDNEPAARLLDARYALLGRPAAILPPRVEIASPETLQRRQAARAERAPGTARWVWVSRVDKAKGADVLQRLAMRRPGETFDVYGPVSGTLAELGLELPNVNYRGILLDVLAADFSQNDGFLFTSPSEGMPNVILEMAQHAIPMILSNVGGITFTLDAGSALIVDVSGDPDVTAVGFDGACDRVLEMAFGSRAEMALRAFERVRARHAPDRYGENARAVLGV